MTVLGSTLYTGLNKIENHVFAIFSRDPESLPTSSYLVVQTPGDPMHGGAPTVPMGAPGSSAASQLNSPSSHPPPFGPTGQGPAAAQGGRGTTVVRT